MAKKTIDDIQVAGKRVLVRCDFNVPMVDGKITSDKRIVAALPTIKKLIADGGKVILCSHMGKPKNGPEAKFSLAPVAERLSDYLGKPVVFADDDNVVGENAKAAVAADEGWRRGAAAEHPLPQGRDQERREPSPRSWHLWRTAMWMTLSAPATVPIAPPRA